MTYIIWNLVLCYISKIWVCHSISYIQPTFELWLPQRCMIISVIRQDGRQTDFNLCCLKVIHQVFLWWGLYCNSLVSSRLSKFKLRGYTRKILPPYFTRETTFVSPCLLSCIPGLYWKGSVSRFFPFRKIPTDNV